MKLYVDLENFQFIQGPGFRTPVTSIRFKRGDAANLEVQFLSGGLTPAEIGDPDTLELTFGVKLRNQFDTEYLVSSTAWTIPASGAANPTYKASPSFNTAPLDTAMDVGEAGEVAEILLMGEITWREGEGAPTSTRTVLVIVENDVNRGTEGTPLTLETPEEWIADRSDPKTISGAPVNPIQKGIMTVTGALNFGDAVATYAPFVQNGELNGKPRYTNSGEAQPSIYWTGTHWAITNDSSDAVWQSADDEVTPDLADWADTAVSPATGTPTVTPSTSPSTAGVLGSERVDGDTMWKVVAIVDGQPVWRAMASKLTGELDALAVTGNTTVGGTLGVTGATTLSSTLAVTGNTTVGGTLGVTGALTVVSGYVDFLYAQDTVTLGPDVTFDYGGSSRETHKTALALGGLESVAGATTMASASISGNATVGGTLVANGATHMTSASVTGALSVGGQLEATAQALANADRVVTRGLGDARYSAVVATKNATTTRTNTATVAADPDLVVAVDANAEYVVDIYLPFNASTGGTEAGFRCNIDRPSGGHFQMHFMGTVASSTALTVNRHLTEASGADVGTNTGNASDNHFRATGVIKIGGTAGNLTLLWAQNTAHESISTSLRRGAYLKLTRII